MNAGFPSTLRGRGVRSENLHSFDLNITLLTHLHPFLLSLLCPSLHSVFINSSPILISFLGPYSVLLTSTWLYNLVINTLPFSAIQSHSHTQFTLIVSNSIYAVAQFSFIHFSCHLKAHKAENLWLIKLIHICQRNKHSVSSVALLHLNQPQCELILYLLNNIKNSFKNYKTDNVLVPYCPIEMLPITTKRTCGQFI